MKLPPPTLLHCRGSHCKASTSSNPKWIHTNLCNTDKHVYVGTFMSGLTEHKLSLSTSCSPTQSALNPLYSLSLSMYVCPTHHQNLQFAIFSLGTLKPVSSSSCHLSLSPILVLFYTPLTLIFPSLICFCLCQKIPDSQVGNCMSAG